MTPDEIRRRLARDASPDWGHSDYDLTPEQRRGDRPLREAAVLVPIIDRPDGPTVLLTRRTAHLSSHAGQISFPGGRREERDPSPEATALRETEEEVGIDPSLVDVVGMLDIYTTVTNYAVTPVVGIVAPDFRPKPDPYEVAEVFETPLAFLLDSKNHHRHTGWFNGVPRKWWAMPYNDYYIWGATAGMLMNLHARLSA
ncbi:MAG: CoA pyrophosphatase [Minwuia sp.]|uniref:CoA pyrophosphatase n=1 Tax=Minwuia sp. TaxID=2493630 RepID=UPI003A86B397